MRPLQVQRLPLPFASTQICPDRVAAVHFVKRTLLKLRCDARTQGCHAIISLSLFLNPDGDLLWIIAHHLYGEARSLSLHVGVQGELHGCEG